jgi:hypothetical protein
MRSHVYLSLDSSVLSLDSSVRSSARKVLRLEIDATPEGFASHNNEKGAGLFLHQHKGSIRRHARLHEEAPGSRQSPRRGLGVNSWVGGKGRQPREMETAAASAMSGKTVTPVVPVAGEQPNPLAFTLND